MNKGFIIAIVVIILAAGAWYWYAERTPAGTSTPPPAATPPPATSGQTYQVVMDSSGFAPADLTVKAGDTVIFVNRDTRQRWPASGLPPTHMLCPGFDALQPLAANESYSYTFTAAKECPMHDHLIPSIRGKITVTE